MVRLGAIDGMRVNGEIEESGTREGNRIFGELEGIGIETRDGVRVCGELEGTGSGRYKELDVSEDKRQGKPEKLCTAER